MALESVSYLYTDDWDRAVYKGNDGVKYIDVDGMLHTISDPGGWNEPDYPVKKLSDVQVLQNTP